MKFDRFKEFVETKSIFFPKAQTFLKEDPLECAVSIKNNTDWLSNLRTTAYPELYGGELDGLSEEEQREKMEQKKQEEIAANEDFRDKVLISCWHANDYESAAMWKLYKGRYNHTIAISINMCNLRSALLKPIHIGEVEYVDYEKVYPTKIRAFKKHISYEHEKKIEPLSFPNISTIRR